MRADDVPERAGVRKGGRVETEDLRSATCFEWNRHHIRLPIMNQKLGTPLSRHTFTCSPSSSTPHTGLICSITSGGKIWPSTPVQLPNLSMKHAKSARSLC